MSKTAAIEGEAPRNPYCGAPERDQSLFEALPACDLPPLPELQSLWSAAGARSLGVGDHLLGRLALAAAWLATGFASFHRGLTPERLSSYLARSGRVNAFALVNAAVSALADDGSSDPFLRAARLARAAWDLHNDLREGRRGPDTFDGRPLESRAYLNLFGTNVTYRDSRIRVFKTPRTDRLMVVVRERHFLVDLQFSGPAPGVALLARALEAVARSTERDPPNAEPTMATVVCATTGFQARTFQRLSSRAVNRESFEAASHCFATVCLDLETCPRTYAEAAAEALTGNVRNRWFPSSLQIVVFGNAKACQVCNPVMGVPGNVMSRAVSELVRRSRAMPSVPAEEGGGYLMKEATWDLTDVNFDRAEADIARVLHDQPATFDIPGFGRTTLGAAGLRPVEFFVIALHHASYELSGRSIGIQQFVSTAGYRNGAMTTADVVTPDVVRLREALSRDTDPARLRRLYDAAVDSQREACRIARRQVSLARILTWYRQGLSGFRARYVPLLLDAVFRVLGRRPRHQDMLISHPAIRAEVPVMGRPGVRLQQLRCLALHYQILDDRIRMTIMPAGWDTTNEVFVRQVESSLQELSTRLGRDAGRPSTTASAD